MPLNRTILATLLLTAAYTQSAFRLVDFDESMGKHDPYEQEFYSKLMNELSNKKAFWFAHVREFGPPKLLYAVIKENYDKQKSFLLNPDIHTRIPKIIHQIWVGPKPIPEHYKKWRAGWEKMTGWTYKLWTDKDVEKLSMINRDRYENEKNMGARSDILRMEILYQYGGLYVDTDFECIQPQLFDIVHHSVDFYCSLHPLDCKGFSLNNAIVGSIPRHPIVYALLQRIKNMTAEDVQSGVVKRGPGLFTKTGDTELN